MEKEFTQAEHRSIDETNVAIDIRDFDLWYTDFQALKSIDLQIPENRCCARSTACATSSRASAPRA